MDYMIKGIAATVYFAIALVALLVLGGPFVQALAILAALSAGMSQLILQDPSDIAEKHGRVFILLALMFAIIAVTIFVLG